MFTKFPCVLAVMVSGELKTCKHQLSNSVFLELPHYFYVYLLVMTISF